MADSSGNVDTQAGLKQTNDKLLKEISALKRKLSENSEHIIRKCTLCGLRVEEKGLRFCLHCCAKDNSISFDDNNDVIIRSFDKVEKSLVCGSCCLEGGHKGHETTVFQPFKRSSTALKQIRKGGASLNALMDGMIKLTTSLTHLMKTPSEMKRQANLVRSEEELDALMGREKEREKLLQQTMSKFTQFSGNVEEFIQNFKKIDDDSRTTFNTENGLPVKKQALLEAHIVNDVVVSFVTISLVNRSKTEYLSCVVVEKPAAYDLNEWWPIKLGPGIRTELRLYCRAGFKTEKKGTDGSVTLKYCEGFLDELPENADTLVVPFKFP